MEKEIKRLFSFRIHEEQYQYLKIKSKENFTTISDYISRLVTEDMKNSKTDREKAISLFFEILKDTNDEQDFSKDFLMKKLFEMKNEK